MINKPKPIVIRAKEIMRICAMSKASANRLLVNIRRQQNRPPRSLVSIRDFCSFTGFSEEDVNRFF